MAVLQAQLQRAEHEQQTYLYPGSSGGGRNLSYAGSYNANRHMVRGWQNLLFTSVLVDPFLLVFARGKLGNGDADGVDSRLLEVVEVALESIYNFIQARSQRQEKIDLLSKNE